MSALNLAQVLWEERLALAGKPLHFPPAPNLKNQNDDPGAISNDGEEELREQKPQERPEVTVEERPIKIADIYVKLNEDNRWALCLSGGGIRSAAFAFGILQRFAAQSIASKHKADESQPSLQQFEYLSTVSGGGYIGSWLSAWLFQERRKYAFAVADKAGDTKTLDVNKVVAALNQRLTDVVDGHGRVMDHEEAESISNLRRDTHYLAPSFSAISPDLWSDIAGIVRNLCLNWVLLVPPMILAVLMTKALSYTVIDSFKINEQSPWFVLIMIMGTLCLISAVSFSAANRPARGLINASQEQFLKYDMAIFLVGASLLVFILGSPNGQTTLSEVIRLVGGQLIDNMENKWLPLAVLVRGTILGVVIYAASWLVGYAWRAMLRESPQPALGPKTRYARFDFFTWCGAGAVFGVLIAAGWLAIVYSHAADQHKAMLVGVFGLPWIVLARVIADVVFIAFAEFIPGADAGLEYQARSGGIFMLAQLGWLIWFGLVLGAPPLVDWLEPALHGWAATALVAAGGLSGAFSVMVGASSKTAAIIRQASGLREYLGLNTLAAIAAAIFAIVLVATLSVVIDWALLVEPNEPDAKHPSWMLVFVAIIAFSVLVAAASCVISINRYSLHSIYRNRLVRAFLGASRDEDERNKSKNAFTDFDSRDSPLLQELWQHGIEPRGAHWKPLHVINAALNLVSSKNLAWQERMAAPFTFSPLHCGSGSAIFPDGAYRTSYATSRGMPYGGRLGLTLGTAMAISGAAVSPNMGYNSSPGVAFLMALFNVRLGWWVANPRGDNQHYWRTKPRIALWPFFMEMFGLTSETKRWVYLSDGGHFENLGIYEMVRRRCRVIVVSDAGCDPEYMFDDLGNALRKIWIDLGVRIDLHGLDRLKKRFKERPTPATEEPYWAVGDILYKEADGAGAKDGLLLYFKSGLHGTEPMDVLSYAMTHSAFPHESTINQFFSESQFESYRILGYEIAERAFETAGCTSLAGDTAGAMTKPPPTLDAIIERLKSQLLLDDSAKRTNGTSPSDKTHSFGAGNMCDTSGAATAETSPTSQSPAPRLPGRSS